MTLNVAGEKGRKKKTFFLKGVTSGRLPPPISLPSSVLCVELEPPSAATSDSFLPHLLCVCVSLPSTYGLVVTTPAIETPPLCV